MRIPNVSIHACSNRVYVAGLLALLMVGLCSANNADGAEQIFSAVSGVGRYQIDSWSMSSGGQYGAFVIDSVTGETSLVFHAEIKNGETRIIKDGLGKPFHSYTFTADLPPRSIKEKKEQVLGKPWQEKVE